MPTTTSVHIRYMIERDLPAILPIEEGSFLDPWFDADFHAVLGQHDHVGAVAELRDGRVVAYMVYHKDKDRLHLTNLAVAPRQRRCGIATQLIQKLKDKLDSKRPRITMDVAETNLDGQLFLKAQGLRCTGLGHDGDEVTYHFECALPGVGDAPLFTATGVNRIARYFRSES